ncbi:CHAP domain-containing protein [Staphylococcus aureus]|uniref:CHAP domain-containing protein n=1 Tax=Staphylococcus aureus TaxID=1280 RepID=UPI000E3CC13B|nr:CHAP domain-containing protein [Staphylococcus aureus]GBT91110.1 staphylococcal secretory antigen, Ssa2 [Staphylococcus aureus]GBT96440.1 staphylococcal secretory antigen, Ssa2 [Staphylococcus aureus]GBT98874.1 staphylococcal secretory antigen, Ssa2 [Staphylococcus aureus]
MKKIATATIATAGFATIAIASGNQAHASEQDNYGYNPNDPTSYNYTYTIDAQGNYHYTWKGNWHPSQLNQDNGYYSYYYYNGYNNYNYNNYNNGYSYNNYSRYNNYSNNNQSYNYNNYNSYNTNSYRTGGLGASYSTSSNNVQVTTTMAPSSNGRSISSGYTSGRNLYTSGQCTYYVFDRVGGKIGSTWGNASNWANAAARAGYTVNNTPKAGAIMQTTQGAYGHVAYVESVNSNGSVRVSEMNYGYGPGVVTSRTISASQAAGYNFIH